MPFSTNEILAALPKLRRYARILTGDGARADDIVEEAITRARVAQAVAPFGTSACVQLFALLRSVYFDTIPPNRKHGAPSPADVREQMPAANADSKDVKRETAPGDELLAQFFNLPVEQREVLALVGVEGMSYEEIATLLRVPVATVMSRLSEARNELRSRRITPLTAPKNAG
jgi:RNA polymerase sigma-70 factor (ECF subfamily)